MNIQGFGITSYTSLSFQKMKGAYRDSKAKKLPKANNPLRNNLKVATALRKLSTELFESNENPDEEVKDYSTISFFDKYNKLKKISSNSSPNEFEKYIDELDNGLEKNSKNFQNIGITKNEDGFFKIDENKFIKSSKEEKEKVRENIKEVEYTIKKAFSDAENFIQGFKTYDSQSTLSKLETGLMFDLTI